MLIIGTVLVTAAIMVQSTTVVLVTAVVTVPTIHHRIVVTFPAPSNLAMEEEMEEVMMEEMIHQMNLQVVKTPPVMIP